MSDRLLNKVLGCVIGATIGDSIGAVVEFRDRDGVRRVLDGNEWVDDMHPFKDIGPNPLGVWRADPPRGTGTDDTRLNQLFLECVVRNGGRVDSQLLAEEYLERCRDPERYYPTAHDLAREHLGCFEQRCRAQLGMGEAGARPAGFAGIYLDDLNAVPILAGLLSLQSAGLLFRGEPEKAYRKAVELDFFDIGYARDAVGLLAAMVSAAIGEDEPDGRRVLEVGIGTNPFGLGGADGAARRMTGIDPLLPDAPSLVRLFRCVDESLCGWDAVARLAKACEGLHPFDPLDILGVPMAIVRYTDGDPVRSILMAANHRCVDREGTLIAMRDTDCVAMVTGALVGAINGIEAFPADWVSDAITANKEVYGFDIEQNARAFYETVHVG